jgi:transcriptional regulator with XRE-family HTH domain
MSEFGSYVRKKREEVPLTLTEMAKRLEISPAYWSRIENGKENPPKDDLIEKAAAILGIPADELFAEAARLPPDMQKDVATIIRMYRQGKT